MPHLSKLQEEYTDRGVRFIGVNIWDEPDKVKPFLKNEVKMHKKTGDEIMRYKHRTTPNQADWARSYFMPAYKQALPGLRKTIARDFPDSIPFVQSCIKETAERFDPENGYDNLSAYSTVDSLLTAAGQSSERINVLCWGSVTESAILVQHCLTTGNEDILKKLRFIAHWTSSSFHQGTVEHPEDVANCREDARACAFLKAAADRGDITYYECGAIGQHGIVSGSPEGNAYFDQFKVSPLGKLFAEGKFARNRVDHSDSATYWTLLGTWGVSLEDILPNGSNPPEIENTNETAFRNASPRIHKELLRRAKAASAAMSK
ncbi:MAG: hypothetical protein ACI9R3_001724 [Verrucomicrobiales bacterium]|jgi:hypothetical protein